jgi:hypothetical protein
MALGLLTGVMGHADDGTMITPTGASIRIATMREVTPTHETVMESNFDSDLFNWTPDKLIYIPTVYLQTGEIINANCRYQIAETSAESIPEVKLETVSCDQSVTIPYANETVLLPKSSLKFTLTLRNWPFHSVDNSLKVIFKVHRPQITDDIVRSDFINRHKTKFDYDDSDSHQSVRNVTERIYRRLSSGRGMVARQLVEMYDHYLDFPTIAIINAESRVNITVLPQVKNVNTVIVTFPSFRELYYDPVMGDYAGMLLSIDNLDHSNLGHKLNVVALLTYVLAIGLLWIIQI